MTDFDQKHILADVDFKGRTQVFLRGGRGNGKLKNAKCFVEKIEKYVNLVSK